MRFKNKFGQVSMEYMILISFIMAMIIPLYLLYNTQYEGTNEQIVGNQANQITGKIVDAAESVYYLGEPSKTVVKVYIPQDIQRITIENQEIVFWVKTRQGIHEVVKYSPVEINGSIENSEGLKYITIESKGNYVQITGN